MARSPRPESLILMILSDGMIRGSTDQSCHQGFSNVDLDSSPSETEGLRLVVHFLDQDFGPEGTSGVVSLVLISMALGSN